MLKEIIHNAHDKASIQSIIDYVGASPSRLKALLEYFLRDEARVSQKTSWALCYIGEKYPQLLEPYHQLFLDQLKKQHRNNAIRRNIVRMYQFVDIPTDFEGKYYDLSMLFLLDPKEAIAIRAFCMRICENIALKYPELIPELMQAIQSIVPHASKGLKNRAGHVLKKLSKHQIIHP